MINWRLTVPLLVVCLAWGQTSTPKRAITDAERNYLGAAGAYLSTANDQSSRVARTMAGASNGSSTLTQIKAAISSARRVESAGYEGDYKARIRGIVPACCGAIAKNVDETHRLFQAAMTEYLAYWKDQNTAHIESGTATFRRCTLLMNSTIADTTKKLKEFKPAKGK